MFFYEADYILIGVAFILGLLSVGLGLPWAGLVLLGLGGLLAFLRWRNLLFFQIWRSAPTPRIWLMATGVALLALLYFYLRIPQPGVTDISRVIPRLEILGGNPIVKVEGTVEDTPLLNRSGKMRFFLNVKRFEAVSKENPETKLAGTASGALYVTVPAKEAEDLHPSQTIAIRGRLYQPRGGQGSFYQVFNFSQYLAAQGAFAGLAGREIQVLDRGSTWGWWAIRERIYQAQLKALGTPEGPVLSAMVLGSRAVPIPFEVSDEFRRVGLAHALAASGFQTSLILSSVLTLTQRLQDRHKFMIGGGTLFLFGSLSGFAPSVTRAVLMGVASLIALVGEQKTRPVSLLLLIAVAMLVYNPLLIQDLGFQFSFLATLGLIVTAPPIAKRLDWLPTNLATLMSVPLAATLWVLPIQLAVFGVFPPYGLLANIVTTFLLEVITIGGFISGLAALIWPLLGTGIAWLMYYPTALLLWIVHFFSRLPGSSLAIGAIAAWQVLSIYGLIFAVWLIPWWQRRWKLASGIAVGLIVVPFLQLQTAAFQVTVLDNTRVPIMVIQEPGANILINSGDENTAAQSVSSFLALQGINQIDWGIATDRTTRTQGGWLKIAESVPVRRFSEIPTARSDEEYRVMLTKLSTRVQKQPLRMDQTIGVGSTEVKLLRADPVALQLKIDQLNWLLLTDPRGSAGNEVWLRSARLPTTDVLWWSGRKFPIELIDLVKPRVAILTATAIAPETLQQLRSAGIQTFTTDRDGAVRWRGGQFEANLESSEAGI